MMMIPVKIKDLPIEYQQAYQDLESTKRYDVRPTKDVKVGTGMTALEFALLVVSFVNIGYYIYSVKCIHSMGGAYYDPLWLIVYLVVPLPSIHLSCGVFYAMSLLLLKPDTKVEFSSYYKYNSYGYACLLLVMVCVEVNEIRIKWGHPSFYTITLWYIYFYGIMNYGTCIIMSVLFIIWDANQAKKATPVRN